MDSNAFYGKRRLCYTNVDDFTNFQGIGNDRMYFRYNSVYSIVKSCVPQDYWHFLAVPEYLSVDDQICWHIDNWTTTPMKLTALNGAERNKYDAIKETTIQQYRNAANNVSGEELLIFVNALRYIDDDRIYCADDKVFLVAWGMALDTRKHKVIGAAIHEYEIEQKYTLTFDAGEHGDVMAIDKRLVKPADAILSVDDLPQVICHDGWLFEGWTPEPSGYIVSGDTKFIARYTAIPIVEPPSLGPTFFHCYFDAGTNGVVDGNKTIRKEAYTTLDAEDIPIVVPKKQYKFKEWNVSPLNCVVDSDKVFIAQYEKKIPWHKRWWLWLIALIAGRGCLRWLIRILLFLLLLWLLTFLLKSCHGCTRRGDNGVVPIDTLVGENGKIIDDNGHTKPVTSDDGKLPKGRDVIVAPVMGEGGKRPPIVEQPGAPSIIGNRLFLFIDDDNDDIESLAHDFKRVYPDDRYCIIGYDKEVKLLVIQIPEDERDEIRKTINGKLPNHNFFVFDEEIYELNGVESNNPADIGWHLKAIHLQKGWEYTRGTEKVKVAIVDDGIQASHPMFKGRITDAYNVFTQNNRLSLGEGHGTHTAGLAAGSDEYYENGASGVAPMCKIIPIQVLDNKLCPLSALVAGVMYAIHHDADVVNISIGPSFRGLDALSIGQQEAIANNHFKNVATLWNKVCNIAAKKNCILVFSAGNDNILTSIPPENRSEAAISVTAVDKRLYPTDFTNYGTCSDVSAPGNDIYSSFPTNAFKSFDGTSMAAPIVAGTIALMKSIKKDLTIEQARNVLYRTGADVYGWIPPMVLVDKALEATKNGDLSRGPEREIIPIPESEDVSYPISGRNPTPGRSVNPILGGGEDVSIPISGMSPTPVMGVDPIPRGEDTPDPSGRVTPTPPKNEDETDYEAIRRLIAEYERKIEELKKLLPN